MFFSKEHLINCSNVKKLSDILPMGCLRNLKPSLVVDLFSATLGFASINLSYEEGKNFLRFKPVFIRGTSRCILYLTLSLKTSYFLVEKSENRLRIRLLSFRISLFQRRQFGDFQAPLIWVFILTTQQFLLSLTRGVIFIYSFYIGHRLHFVFREILFFRPRTQQDN